MRKGVGCPIQIAYGNNMRVMLEELPEPQTSGGKLVIVSSDEGVRLLGDISSFACAPAVVEWQPFGLCQYEGRGFKGLCAAGRRNVPGFA